MKPSDLLNEFERLIVESQVVKASLTKERRIRRFEAYIKVRLILIDDSVLDVTQYIQATEEDNAQVERYSYHWMDASSRLIIRWDNVRHYPDLPNLPYHRHDKDEKKVLPSEPMTLPKVLDIIATRLNE